MKSNHHTTTLLGLGTLAGLAGTAMMLVLRKFDEKYAPKTIPDAKEDPGHYVVGRIEHVAGKSLPKFEEELAVLSAHVGYGTSFGIAYALLRGRFPGHRSSLIDGAILGTAVYAAGHAGWLPAIGLSKPVWKQESPEVAGELFRHIAYGIATAATYGAIDAVL